MYTRVTFVLEYISNLLTCVFSVPLIEQVLHRYNIINTLIGVYVIHNSYIPYTKPIKIFFKQLTDNKTVSTKS